PGSRQQILERGAVAQEFRTHSARREPGRSQGKPAAAAPARSAGRRRRLPFRRPPIRLAPGQGLEDPGAIRRRGAGDEAPDEEAISLIHRHARACPGHHALFFTFGFRRSGHRSEGPKAWMPATSAGMTAGNRTTAQSSYCRASVFMRCGTWPTLMSAIRLIRLASMTDTVLSAVFAT